MVIAIIAAFAWSVKTMYAHYDTKWKELEAKKAAFERGKTLIARWQEMDGEYDLIARNFFRKDPALFKRYVEDEARAAGVTINSLSPTRTEDSIIVTILMNLKTSSSYRGFLSFITSLEEKNIGIERVFVTKSPDGKTINEDLTLRSFILKE
jgi:hypothetical protein